MTPSGAQVLVGAGRGSAAVARSAQIQVTRGLNTLSVHRCTLLEHNSLVTGPDCLRGV